MMKSSSLASSSSSSPTASSSLTSTTTTGGGGNSSSASSSSSSNHHHHHHHHHNGGGSSLSRTTSHNSTTSSSSISLFEIVTSKFEQLTNSTQLGLLSLGVFLFFGLHNLLQEAIMSIDIFDGYGVMLGYMEVLGVAICSTLERRYITNEYDRIAPLSSYPLLTFLLISSSSLSNISLNYVNFPTKVVIRSSKLIPTMIFATFIQRKQFTAMEYTFAICISAGLILFTAADWKTTPSYHPIGLVLLTGSVCADAILPNAQERLFKIGSSRTEVTMYTNILSCTVMTLTMLLNGQLLSAIHIIYNSQLLTTYFIVYTFIAHIAISLHMAIVKRFGGVCAVLVATARKAMTLILSFLLFPKPFSWLHPLGATMVLGGLLLSSLYKIRASTSKNNNTGTNSTATGNNSKTNGGGSVGGVGSSNDIDRGNDYNKHNAAHGGGGKPSIFTENGERKPLNRHPSDIDMTALLVYGNNNNNKNNGNNSNNAYVGGGDDDDPRIIEMIEQQQKKLLLQ